MAPNSPSDWLDSSDGSGGTHTPRPCTTFATARRTDVLVLILLIAAFILFALATFGVATRFNLVAAGLACWVLTVLLPQIHA